jgi:hypothetical protein
MKKAEMGTTRIRHGKKNRNASKVSVGKTGEKEGVGVLVC